MQTQSWKTFLMRIWRDRRGQDLIEYALMAGFVAVAAGAIMPGVASSISTIFSVVTSVMATAARMRRWTSSSASPLRWERRQSWNSGPPNSNEKSIAEAGGAPGLLTSASMRPPFWR